MTEREYPKARKQLGTLGGGNHFIEIQKDEDDFVLLMIHSGSRNVGKQVADHYNKVANFNRRLENEPVEEGTCIHNIEGMGPI